MRVHWRFEASHIELMLCDVKHLPKRTNVLLVWLACLCHSRQLFSQSLGRCCEMCIPETHLPMTTVFMWHKLLPGKGGSSTVCQDSPFLANSCTDS